MAVRRSEGMQRARWGALAAVIGIGLASGTATLAAHSVRAQGAEQPARHPTMLTGTDWAAFGPKEKEAYLSGFLAGAALEQARAVTATAGQSDSGAAASDAITALRRAHALRFPYAPSVYAAQLDDYYWWANHSDTPIVDVMVSIDHQMRGRQ